MSLSKFWKFCKSWKWAILLVFICLVGIPLSIIFGLQSVGWGNDFWPNALSEFLGMFVDLIFGALFTFIVIDKYTQYHKNLQWQKIKSITYKNLYFILSNIVSKLNMSLHKEMRIESYILTEDIETLNDYLSKTDFESCIKSLIKNVNKKIEEESPCANGAHDEQAFFVDEQLYVSLVKFKQHAKVDIVNLRNLTIPKLLTFSDDVVLLDDLIELEELITALLTKIKTANSNKKIKCAWLIALIRILTKIESINNSINDEINIDGNMN